MADIIAGNGLIQYEWGGHRWFELENPPRVTEQGRGGFTYASSFLVLPGSGYTAVQCYVDIYVCLRVDENLDCQIKLVPGDAFDYTGCRGIYFPYVINAYDWDSYQSVLVVYPRYFALTSVVASTNHLAMVDAWGNVINGYDQVQYQNSDFNSGITILKKLGGNYDYGSMSLQSNGRRYHWQIGLGSGVDYCDMSSRWSGNSLSSAWKGSSAWTWIGNLERNFGWGPEEDYNGYIYFCGSAYYDNSSITYGAQSIARCVTIPGLKRLLDYYPWEIRKGNTWYSCNRSGGYLKDMKSGNWSDLKNRIN